MLTDFIQPLSDSEIQLYFKPELPVHFFRGNDSEIEGHSIAILGIKDARGFDANAGTAEGPDHIRNAVYALHNFPLSLPVIDLGNIMPGATFQDTHEAMRIVVNEINRKGLIIIILGGDNSLVYSQYKGMANADYMLNMVMVDEKFTFTESSEYAAPNHQDYLFRIFVDSPSKIEHFSLLGYQTYFIPARDVDLLEQMNMEVYRLGLVREDIREAEPIVREADLLAFNVAALKACDAPGYVDASPNGFFSDEACQILRYAGSSDKMQCLGIYNYNPDFDQRGITATGIAQMLWYFIDGIHLRRADYPIVDEKDFQKFTVSIEGEEDIVFMKSLKSNRWWMKVPASIHGKKVQKMIPCTYKDYMTAMESEVPDRWIQAYGRLN